MQTSPCTGRGGEGSAIALTCPSPSATVSTEGQLEAPPTFTPSGDFGVSKLLVASVPISLSPWDPSPLPGCSDLPSKWVEP